ncbi:replication factor C protein subunit 3 [Ascosphaera apis ARSEF 7405]|uniref:Replication factor C protein subunit 3 n=1 Tax=Ascosphaera apis ARSEF 7405 TaxID=392613 RepID=A0A168BCD2_9EURO|nr:replication factor C protein subunit 3 [Ascosphaera apis ARSEF 7405]
MAFSDDEMDLDEVPTTTTTSLPEDKDRDTGKRIVADLPADLDDTLPWVEKYRPSTLDNVCGHQDVIATINKFVETNRLPHLLLYGPPGTGKTSTILALARRIYGAANMRQMVLELNASDDRGIDVVREQIKTFASSSHPVLFALLFWLLVTIRAAAPGNDAQNKSSPPPPQQQQPPQTNP